MSDIFENKKPDYKKLIDFGFKKKGQIYSYNQEIYNGQFELVIEIEGKDVTTKLFDESTGELYTLHLIEGAEGTFVGQVRNEYEMVLKNISENCFQTDVFEYKQSLQVLNYALSQYGTEPEYLWEKFPRNAVCRRKDNKKWYFALLSVKASTLGFETDEIIEVIDLRASKDKVPELLTNQNIYPAYHMNKKSWITIVLNGSMRIEDIYRYIDSSYLLAKK